MAAKIYVPKPKELAEHLEPLIGRTTTLKPSAAPNKFKESCHTARYLTRDGKLGAICQFDLELAVFLGAALAMIPAGGAEDAVKAGALTGPQMDAFREVSNVLAGILCLNAAPHVRWADVTPSLAALPADAKAIAAKPFERADFRVDIDGYGGGNLSILTTKVA